MERRRSSIPFICFLAPDFLSGRGIWRSMAGEREREREDGREKISSDGEMEEEI